MNHFRFVFSLASAALGLTLMLATSGACSSSSSPGSCVTFTVAAADVACSQASDCTFVGALQVCPGDPSCGDENPVNNAAAQRYASATAGVPLKQVECGAPSPVGCVAQKCVVLVAGEDAGADGG
jgi:hypothetical protein